MSRRLRTGIIGCGKVAHLHAQALGRLPEAEFVAVTDVDAGRAQAFASRYGVTAGEDLSGVDVAIVCTPHPLHKEAAMAAMNRGAHVLVEKPLATTVADCDEMIAVAARCGVKLGAVSQRRFFEPIQRMKAAIGAGKIGRPILGTVNMFSWRDEAYYKSDPWRGKWDTEGGGVLINQAPHHLDILQWLMGPIEEVTGRWANLNHPYVEVEDTALALLRFRGGGLGSITVSLSQNPGIYTKIHIHGSSGYSVGTQTDTGATFVAGVSEKVAPPFNDLWTIPGESVPPSEVGDTDYHLLQDQEFLRAVLEDREPAVNGEEGRKVVELISAIYQSGREGRSVLLTALLALMCWIAPVKAADLALTHARIYTSPEAAPISDGTILIRDGRIAEVGADVKVAGNIRTIDCDGMTVTAGLWNSHVHIFTAGLLHAERLTGAQLSGQLETMLTKWGFTTVFDLGSILANTNLIRERIARGDVKGPRILTVGEPFFPRGGIPVYIKPFLEENHVVLPEDQSPADAVVRLKRQLQGGADGAKIFAGSIQPQSVLVMPQDLASAIVREAHSLGKPVFAHPSNSGGVEVAIQSGVDVLAHVPASDGALPPAVWERVKAAHMALIPTLTLFEWEADRAKLSREETATWRNRAVDQLKGYVQLGGEILFGTDVGYIDRLDTAEEYRLMALAGMSFSQVLASLTTNPANRFKQAAHSGRIAKGLDADLTVFIADPAVDVMRFARVRYTIRGGTVIFGDSPVRVVHQ
jgi:predicted dehydrogenase/imidazolonepropionase-like amidohydrolase